MAQAATLGDQAATLFNMVGTPSKEKESMAMSRLRRRMIERRMKKRYLVGGSGVGVG